MQPINWVRYQIASLPENVGLARACAAAFATQLNCTLEEIDEIKLVMSEAVSNSILHGYENRRDQAVMIELAIYPGQVLELIVEDTGRGIANVEQALEASFTTEPDRMGLGFVFIKSFVDSFEVVSEPNRGTRVRMVRSFASEPKALRA
ncbi:MAG: anti-sigma F factor [Solirubrobacterales bacterium]